MITLIHIEPGMVVAGRYVVSTIDRPWIEEAPEAGAVCTALDAILDEPVLIHVADAEKSGDMLDAARRVSILGDHRIAPTLDVGQANGLDYVVVERIAAASLGEILPRTPLSVDTARALIGEIGTVLVAAARRGLFHMFLRPSTAGITSKGGVLVSGIGIDAALALGTGVLPAEDWTPTKASRQDALDLVRLFYAALTGHWPGDEAVGGIPPSGRENSRIARARSLNPELPPTVDDFVSGILTGADPGPGSVAEVLGYLAEWDPELLRYVTKAPVRENDSLFNRAPRSFEEATRLPAPGSGGIGSNATASEDQVKAALVRIGITRPGTRGLAAGVVGKTTGRYADRMQMREASSFPIGASQIDHAAKEWDEWEPEQTYSEYSEYADREYDDNMTTPIMERGGEDPTDPDTQALDIVSDDDEDNDTRVILDDEDDGSWFLGGMFETHEQQREHQLREYERERRIARAKEEEARRRVAALEAASAERRAEANASAPPKQVRRLSPGTVDDDATTQPMSTTAATDAATAPLPTQAPDAGPAGRGDPKGTGSVRKQGDDGRPTVAAAVGTAGATVAGATGAAAGAARTGGSAPAGAAGASGRVTGTSTSGGTAGAAAAGAPAGAAGSGTGPQGTDRRKRPLPWIILAVVLAAAVVIGFVVVNQNSQDEPATVVDSPAPTQPAEESTEDAAEEEPAVPPEIDTVSALDPEGDDSENDDSAADVMPGEKGSWRTDRYNSAEFGNLKSGVGLLVELKEETIVKEVEVKSSSSGGAFEIRSGSDPADAKKVGEGEFDKDGVTVELDEGVETDSLILWITELPQGEGGYRASISTVAVK
ncbi:hypothetical protein DFO66_102291 [Brevibacterium sanguinis]|uniref:Virulence factor MviN n=2 Tax=Brevibacterium TaxID=1696 RepID=A0A366IQ67_9MICO|nr:MULTISPECIES: virulence factor MviN [Brevibacterium]RBP67238.1 hypothetical protein DFO66_102291 [Brevibacterium sanguinis]RBP73763.1 hypothetical protein DFO65_102291 [Brevibacterium celere]